MKTKLIKYLTLTSLLLTASSAWAETIDCTAITTLPYIITTQGIYCFTGNLATSMTSGIAIEIQTNNVTIDMNGWKLGGLGAGAGTTAKGIYAWQRKNITISNGTISGFFLGIWLHDSPPYTTSQGHLIEDIRADQNTKIGIDVFSRGSIVRRNQVVDTGGSSVESDAYGIVIIGPGARVLNNDISGSAATGSGIGGGVFVHAADGTVLESNRIDDISSGTGSTYGLYIANSNDVLVVGNRLTGAVNGIYYNGSTGKYKDNLTSSVTTPFTNGTDAGGNN